MKRTIYILGILLTGIVGSLLTWYIGCCGCSKTNPPTEQSKTKPIETTSRAFVITDKDGEFDYTTQGNFNFHQNSDKIITPIDNGVINGVAKLKDYLNTNEHENIDITGLYSSNEINNTAFPNLGIARANSVKKYFIKKGIDSNNITLKGKLDDTLVLGNDIYSGPVLFNTHRLSDQEISNNKNEMENIHAHIVKDPLLLHFKFGSNQLNFSNKERSKMYEIVVYMDHNHDATLDAIGHTDNVGNATKNTKLGLQRANFVKDYLIGIGINADQIKTASEGPNRPIQPNTTEKGRAENRRVEIILE